MGKAKTLRRKSKAAKACQILTIPTEAQDRSIKVQKKSLRKWEAKLSTLMHEKGWLISGLMSPTNAFLDQLYRNVLDIEEYEACKASGEWPWPKEIIDWMIGTCHDEILEAKAKIQHKRALLRRLEEQLETRKHFKKGANDRGSGGAGAPGMVA